MLLWYTVSPHFLLLLKTYSKIFKLCYCTLFCFPHCYFRCASRAQQEHAPNFSSLESVNTKFTRDCFIEFLSFFKEFHIWIVPNFSTQVLGVSVMLERKACKDKLHTSAFVAPLAGYIKFCSRIKAFGH